MNEICKPFSAARHYSGGIYYNRSMASGNLSYDRTGCLIKHH
jgi:hypothetical protein